MSVVLPVRDGEAFLDEAIQGIRNQTLTDLELIVVDDGSTDRSAEIVRAHAAADPRVRLVAGRAEGAAAARNLGASLATGRWIAVADGDDVSYPDRLARQLAHAEEDPEVVAWGAWVHAIDASGRIVAEWRIGPGDRETFEQQHGSGTQLDLTHSMLTIRREVLEAVGGYDERLRRIEDPELIDRLGDHGPVLVVPATLGAYRLHVGNITTAAFAEGQQVTRFIAARRRARRAGGDLDFETYRQWEEEAPLQMRARHLLEDVGGRAEWSIVVEVARGRWIAAIGWLFVAFLLRPRKTLGRLLRQGRDWVGLRASRRSEGAPATVQEAVGRRLGGDPGS